MDALLKAAIDQYISGISPKVVLITAIIILLLRYAPEAVRYWNEFIPARRRLARSQRAIDEIRFQLQLIELAKSRNVTLPGGALNENINRQIDALLNSYIPVTRERIAITKAGIIGSGGGFLGVLMPLIISNIYIYLVVGVIYIEYIIEGVVLGILFGGVLGGVLAITVRVSYKKTTKWQAFFIGVGGVAAIIFVIAFIGQFSLGITGPSGP